MDFRLATKEDLPELKNMYKKIIKRMDNMDIKIWNKYYPYEQFKDDIDTNQLYVLIDNNIILAAFALFEDTDLDSNLVWEEPEARAMYINRIGINVDYTGKGLGLLLLEEAKKITKEKNIDYLRLLVVRTNYPAINLYVKAGFKQVPGLWEEYINKEKTIVEFGFELKI